MVISNGEVRIQIADATIVAGRVTVSQFATSGTNAITVVVKELLWA